MRIIPKNWTDEATITAVPDMIATLPATNLQTQYREQVARSSGVAVPQVLYLALPRQCLFSGATLYRSNLSAYATWRVQIYSDVAYSVQVYDSGTVNGSSPKTLGELLWGIDPLGAGLWTDVGYAVADLWFTRVAGQSVKVTISDPTNAAGYLEAARLVMGDYFDFTYAPSIGSGLRMIDTTTFARSDGGSIRAERGFSYRELSLQFRFMAAVDRDRLTALLLDRGLTRDVYASVFPGVGGVYERNHKMLARMPSLGALTYNTGYTADHTMTLQES